MNETERNRILTMVADGTISPNEAAQLLSTLADAQPSSETDKGPNARQAGAETPFEIQMRRPDGSYYTVQVPRNLVAIFWEIAKIHIKEQIRTAAKETAQGARNVILNQTDEIRALLRRKRTGEVPAERQPSASEMEKAEARRVILSMVQDGRLGADDAARLLEQLDSLAEYRKSHHHQPDALKQSGRKTQ